MRKRETVWDRLPRTVGVAGITVTPTHAPSVVVMGLLNGDEIAARRTLPAVTVTAMQVHLQTTSLPFRDLHLAMSRWRGSSTAHDLWKRTPLDLKHFVMCAENMYGRTRRYMSPPPYYWTAPPIAMWDLTPATITRDVMHAHRLSAAMHASIPSYVCTCEDPRAEVVVAACNAAGEGVTLEDAREVAHAASGMLGVFTVDGTPVQDLITAGLPEWAHPLAQLQPLKGTLR